MDKLYKNEEWLRARYLDDGLSVHKVGKLVGVAGCTISRWLREYGVPMREKGVKRNHVVLSPTLMDIINGGLLGDWSVCLSSKSAGTLQTASKYLSFIEWASSILENNGITSTPSGIYHSIVVLDGGYGPYDSYHYASKAYQELLSVRKLWYPNGKKIIPENLELNPTSALWWYIGDGCLYCRKNRSPSIILYTNGFVKEDVLRLMEMLKAMGIETTRRESNNTIQIRTTSTMDFLNYIGPCPKQIEPIYGYKWDVNRNGPVGLYKKHNPPYSSE